MAATIWNMVSAFSPKGRRVDGRCDMKILLKNQRRRGAKRPVEGRKPGGGTLTSPANEKAPETLTAPAGAKDLHHERLPQGQAATVQALTVRPHQQSAPKGTRKRAADLNGIPVTDWTQVRHQGRYRVEIFAL